MNQLSTTENIAFNLIRSDLKAIATIVNNSTLVNPSYINAFLPYLGLITDGCEQWGNKVKIIQSYIPKFTKEEKEYYTKMRKSIKLWDLQFNTLDSLLKQEYLKSNRHFSSICNPIARRLKLYYIYGVYTINGKFCDNTILDGLFIPDHEFNMDGEKIKTKSFTAGQIAGSFGASIRDNYEVNKNFKPAVKDYGSIIKPPFGGNQYSIDFVIFSLLCSVNFVLYGINRLFNGDIPLKLRISYIEYYYILSIMDEILKNTDVYFRINSQWKNTKFRNCMAHYGLGSVLKQNEVNTMDTYGGLTDKIFEISWQNLLSTIDGELMELSLQFEKYLNIKC